MNGADAGRGDTDGVDRPDHTVAAEVRQLAHGLGGPLRRLVFRRGDTTVEIEWADSANRPAPVAATSGAATDPPPDSAQRQPDGSDPTGEPAPAHVVAPMVGTFYRSPEPGEPPFVEVGDRVEVGAVVAIVEAMKLMNEVTAGAAGVVTTILAADGTPVEYGQPLIALARPPAHQEGSR